MDMEFSLSWWVSSSATELKDGNSFAYFASLVKTPLASTFHVIAYSTGGISEKFPERQHQ
jgi:hypothetical protein